MIRDWNGDEFQGFHFHPWVSSNRLNLIVGALTYIIFPYCWVRFLFKAVQHMFGLFFPGFIDRDYKI